MESFSFASITAFIIILCSSVDSYSTTITITACDYWKDASFEGSLTMKLMGDEATSPFFVVNGNAYLPIEGTSKSFTLSEVTIGNLLQTHVFLSDSVGYCMKELIVAYDDANGDHSFTFSSDDYFGNGIVINPECAHSFVAVDTVSADLPLFPCMGMLKFETYQTRHIYDVSIHTCIMDDSGMSIDDMSELSVSLTSYNNVTDAMATSEAVALDAIDYQSLALESILTIARSDITITSESSTFNSLSDGTAMAIVLKESDVSQTISFYIGDETTDALSVRKEKQFNDYYMIMFTTHVSIDKSTIYTLGIEAADVSITDTDVYFIFKENEDMPYKYMETKGDWVNANDVLCADYNGLASIHSEVEGYIAWTLMTTTIDNPWIGLNDRLVDFDWRWSDGTAFDWVDWKVGEPNNLNNQDCVKIQGFAGGANSAQQWNDNDCSNNFPAICNNPTWKRDETRVYQINLEYQDMSDDITVINIQNGGSNAFCVDWVTVNGESAKSLMGNWISSESDSEISTSIFTWPVCDTEMVGFNLDFDNSDSEFNLDESTNLLTAECSNYNKHFSTSCSISQSITTSVDTSVEFTKSTSSATEYTTEKGSTFSMEKSKSISIGNTFEKKLSLRTTKERSFGVEFGSTMGREFSKSQSFSRSQETSRGRNNVFGRSDERTLTCSGSTEVPPLHSVEYTLALGDITTNIRTTTDLKLTLCSALLGDYNNENNYIYIYDVPGFLNISGSAQCSVTFNAVTALDSTFTCDQEQKLAIAKQSKYVPQCEKDATTGDWLYESCQCETSDSLTHKVCYCVDQTNGNIKDGSVVDIDVNGDYSGSITDACAAMDCLNWVSAKIVSPIVDDYAKIVSPNDYKVGSVIDDVRNLITGIEAFLLIFAVVLLIQIWKSCKISKNDKFKYNAVQMDTTADEAQV